MQGRAYPAAPSEETSAPGRVLRVTNFAPRLGDAVAVTRFETDKVYDRKQLHQEAAAEGLKPGNANAGIVQVGDELCIFWNPFRRLYVNAWVDEPREFIYSGEGSTGPMGHTAGNRALIAAEDTDRRVTVFYKIYSSGSQWKCLGQFEVSEHVPGVSIDRDGSPRPDLRFRLVLTSASGPATPLPVVAPAPPPKLPDEKALWAAVNALVQGSGGKRKRAVVKAKDKRQSDPMKTLYVNRRAIDFGGMCEACFNVPAWVGDDGLPHFQAHHIEPDVDLVDWIGALCGSCHDRLHHGSDRVAQAAILRATVKERQLALGRITYELGEIPGPPPGN